jgi:hypothetical protein
MSAKWARFRHKAEWRDGWLNGLMYMRQCFDLASNANPDCLWAAQVRKSPSTSQVQMLLCHGSRRLLYHFHGIEQRRHLCVGNLAQKAQCDMKVFWHHPLDRVCTIAPKLLLKQGGCRLHLGW